MLAQNRQPRGTLVRNRHDEKTANRKTRVQIDECIHCGLVHVAVETHNRPRSLLDARERIPEPTLEELHAIVEEVVHAEIFLDLFA